MGFFSDLFGGHPADDGEGSTYASARNSAEAQASADYLSETLNTGEDPIPNEVPDWAADLPSPSDYASEDNSGSESK